MPKITTQNIQKFSDKQAHALLWKINFIGGAILLIFFGYMVLSHYENKLSYLFSSIEESIAQAILRGDQHILDNMSRSIEQAEDIDAVWVTESTHNQIVGFYSTSVAKDSLDIAQGRTILDGYWLKTLIAHQVKSKSFGPLGTVYLLLKIPVLWILFLGACLFGIFLFISLSILKTFRRAARQLSTPIENLALTIQGMGPEGLSNLTGQDHQFEEVQSVATSFRDLLAKKEESDRVAKASLQDAVKGRIASVVVHDVRQRLHNAFAAVEALKRKTQAERELTVLHSALTSIDQTIVDIPNVDLSNLPLVAYGQANAPKPVQSVTAYPILALVSPIIKEYQTKAEVEGRKISFDMTCNDFSLKAGVDPVKFQRVISNLLSNSMKAISAAGAIKVKIFSEAKRTIIRVEDNGHGCSKSDLDKLGTVGFTTFESDGSGTGLASCAAAVKSWGGNLKFESEQSKGFSAIVDLPIVNNESVFLDEIPLSDKSEIVTVDDNKEIHKRWQSRLGRRKIRSFYSAKDFLEWANKNRQWDRQAILFDLRLGNDIDGIELAERVPSQVAKWIVTNNWSEPETILRCRRAKLKLLSKDLLETVPIV